MGVGQSPTYREAWLPTAVMVGLTFAVFLMLAIRSRNNDESEIL